MIEMDEYGHFPGCYTHGCVATSCALARWMARTRESIRRDTPYPASDVDLPAERQDLVGDLRMLDGCQRVTRRGDL